MSSGNPTINHLAYIDDLVVFSSKNTKSIKAIMEKIKWYEKNSSQKVNKDKKFSLNAPGTGAIN